MVEVAASRAAEQKLSNVKWQQMRAEELPGDGSEPTEEMPVFGALPAAELAGSDEIRTADAFPEAEEMAAADEFPSEPGEGSSEMPDLPPSRTLAELYERQGFPEEARQIYDRLDAEPEGGSLSRADRFAPPAEPAEAPPGQAMDPRSRKRHAIEAWLSRVKTNASAGAR